jgi:O-antigen/teichoic acid export membrane protein
MSSSSKLSFLFKDSMVYGLSSAMSKAFSLITFPLLIKNFTVSEFGIIDYFMVLANFITIFFVFGQDSAVARFFYDSETEEDKQNVISQSLSLQLVGLLIFIPFLWNSNNIIKKLLINNTEALNYFKIILLQIPFLLFINFSQNILKWTFSRKRFLFMSLGYTVIQTTLLIYVVLILKQGIKSVFYVSLFTNIFFGLIGLISIRKWIIIPVKFDLLPEMIKFALPFGAICAFSAFSPTLERSYTNLILGMNDLGLYAAGNKIAMLIGLIVSAFQTAWGPYSLSMYKESKSIDRYNLVLKYFTLFICLSIFILTLSAIPVIKLMASSEYLNAFTLVFPLTLSVSIEAISSITEIGISISKKSYLYLISNFLSVTTTFLLLYIFIPYFGIVGIAYSVLFGKIVKSIINFVLAQKVYFLPWNYLTPAKIIFFTLILSISSNIINTKFGIPGFYFINVFGFITLLFYGWNMMIINLQKKQLLNYLKKYFIK